MDWKQKIKWKLFVILMALLGILVVWFAGKAGEKKGNAEKEMLREQAVKENEWASLLSETEPQEKEEPEDSLEEMCIRDRVHPVCTLENSVWQYQKTDISPGKVDEISEYSRDKCDIFYHTPCLW